MFKKAVKHEAKLRLALAGPSGSGKTYTALAIGTSLGKTAVVDTESGSASKYADLFDFDVAEMSAPFSPAKYVTAIQQAAAAGYEVVILDSLSHAWFATGGVLDIVDQAAKRSRSQNTYMAWKEGTPVHNALIEAIVTAPIHVIGTMRSKTEYALVENDRGKLEPRKMGLAPVQRDGFEYEFDVMMDMDIKNTGLVTKSRCPQLTGAVIDKPGADVAMILREWLSGEPAPPPPPIVKLSPLETARQKIGTIARPKMEDVIDAVVVLGAYSHENHAINSIKLYPFDEKQQAAIDSGKFTFDAGQAISTAFALNLFDWLIARKDSDEPDEPPSLPLDEGY